MAKKQDIELLGKVAEHESAGEIIWEILEYSRNFPMIRIDQAVNYSRNLVERKAKKRKEMEGK